MNRKYRLTALMLGLLMLLSPVVSLAEAATGTEQPPAFTQEVAAPSDEPVIPLQTEPASTEEILVNTPVPEVTPAPVLPWATMAPLAKEDMPLPNPDAKAEAIVTAVDGSSLYETPSLESAVKAPLTAGSVLNLLKLGFVWSHVKSGEAEGYVPTKALSFGYGSPQPGLALVTAPNGKLTMRGDMSTKSKSIGKIPSGRVVVLLARGETFSLVRFEGKEGYVLTLHLKEMPASSDLGTLTLVHSLTTERVANVRVRSVGNKKGMEYTKVMSGKSVVVLGYADGWAEIEYEGYHGYMMETYLKPVETAKTTDAITSPTKR